MELVYIMYVTTFSSFNLVPRLMR